MTKQQFLRRVLLKVWPPARAAWSLPYDVEPLRRRLGELPYGDPLMPLLIGFIDAQTVKQSATHLQSDETAQFAGRIAMCAVFRNELTDLWNDTHGEKR